VFGFDVGRRCFWYNQVVKRWECGPEEFNGMLKSIISTFIKPSSHYFPSIVA
jgi:hypothetical protein